MHVQTDNKLTQQWMLIKKKGRNFSGKPVGQFSKLFSKSFSDVFV